jgi:uncharacterized protein
MAGSLFILLDDIAAVLDDVAVMTKVAAKKTAGVLGDDLALNAQQVAGVNADRELPVVWAVAKGSFKNKLVLVPAALAISALAPWAIIPLLMLGGAYLCFEGFEKIAHSFLHKGHENDHPEATTEALLEPSDAVAMEKEKIKGAIRTDFILSAEIIVITLGTVATAPFMTKFTVLSLVAVVMTVGVYGLVAGIVKMDDAGLYLTQKTGDGVGAQLLRKLGFGLLAAAPMLMKFLSIAGTAAMFLVGGGIITHGIAPLHHWVETFAATLGDFGKMVFPIAFDAVMGVLIGAVIVGVVMTVQMVMAKSKQQAG